MLAEGVEIPAEKAKQEATEWVAWLVPRDPHANQATRIITSQIRPQEVRLRLGWSSNSAKARRIWIGYAVGTPVIFKTGTHDLEAAMGELESQFAGVASGWRPMERTR